MATAIPSHTTHTSIAAVPYIPVLGVFDEGVHFAADAHERVAWCVSRMCNGGGGGKKMYKIGKTIK
jgi:hypothetical protein